MRYIELLGLPGAGKSTIACEVVRLLQANGQQVLIKGDILRHTMRTRIKQGPGLTWKIAGMLAAVWKSRIPNLIWEKHRCAVLVRFIARYPDLAGQIIACATQAGPPAWVPQDVVCDENLMTWLFDVACYYQAARDFLSDHDIIVLEEAFCQHAYYLLAFHRDHRDPERLHRYLQAIPRPDALIAITVSPTVCEQRMHARSKGIASDILTPLTVEQRLTLLTQRFAMYQDIATYFEQQGVPVLRIDNTDYAVTQRQLQEGLIASCLFAP